MFIIPDEHDVTLYLIYEREKEDKRAEAIDILFEYVDDYYQNENFDGVNELFKRVDLAKLSTTLVVGFLCISNCAREKIACRKVFAEKCRQHLWDCGRLKNKRQEKRLLGGLMEL